MSVFLHVESYDRSTSSQPPKVLLLRPVNVSEMDNNGSTQDSSGTTLDRAAVEDALDGLARCPDTLAMVYSSLALTQRGIANVDILSEFPKLQTIDVSGNKITSLECLSKLPHLLELDASDNELTRVLEFRPAHCRQSAPERVDATSSSADAWTEGDSAVGSTLQRAVLRGNRIEVIDDLSHHSYLQHLDLNDNRIARIQGLSALGRLRSLSLCGNALTEIGGELRGLLLEELHLDRNQIEVLDGELLSQLPRLRVLTAAGNRITALAGLAFATGLSQLDLSSNKVSELVEVSHLGGLQLLCDVQLSGNPIAAEQYYRRRVLVQAQQLTLLDGIIVSAEEKVKALNMHGADLENRQATFGKHLPEAEFVNTLPPVKHPSE